MFFDKGRTGDFMANQTCSTSTQDTECGKITTSGGRALIRNPEIQDGSRAFLDQDTSGCANRDEPERAGM